MVEWRAVLGAQVKRKAPNVLKMLALGRKKQRRVAGGVNAEETFVKKRLHKDDLCCYSGGRSRDRRLSAVGPEGLAKVWNVWYSGRWAAMNASGVT